MKIIFLDVDGVLNCQLFYEGIDKSASYVEQNICRDRISWLNDLCKKLDIKIVISSTWRMGRTIDELKEIFKEVGGEFDIIGVTPVLREEGYVRGNEIALWIEKNIEGLTGLPSFDFHDYAIIDDDSDMLLMQANNFFQTDTYSGLTPNTIYRIERFFTKKYFPNK